MVTHIGARYGGPIWLAAGVVVYLMVRRGRGTGLLEHVEPVEEAELPHAEFSKILVPMKLGEIGEEMVATAVKLAQERDAAVVALHVIRVPLDQPLDAPLYDEEERAAASLAEAPRSAKTMESRSRGTRSARGRSARRSSRRPRRRAPT
jgi:Universal stress protein family.